jgi:hypothetical protein
MPNPLSRRLWRFWLPQALVALLVVSQLQADQQAVAPPQAPAAAPQPVPAPPSPAAGQPTPGQPTPGQPLSTAQLPVEQSLKIRVLAGNGEMNDMERRLMAPLVVQVVDTNERAMDGAEVVFRFPLNGPSATFAGGKNSVVVRTNSGGQAAAVNWMANGQVGKFEVHVNASYGNQVGEATVSMENVTRVDTTSKNAGAATSVGVVKHESLWSHRWFKIAVIGGAAIAVGLGVYFATRGSSKSGSTVGISPGPPTVTSP